MWWYNVLGDNKGISHLLWLDPITSGSILLAVKLVALKRGNTDLVLIVKSTEWRKFIGYMGKIIDANPSRVRKKSIYYVHIGYISRPSSV